MNIDYDLRIIGEKTNFKPRTEFITPLKNSEKKIFEITAGNGYGKTFLLNLIAYAFSADKLGDDYILKTLRDSISRYNDQDSYDLKYKLDFNLPDGKKILLSKESHQPRIAQFDGGSPVGVNNLHKAVSILYDVPTDPSERLNAVIKDLSKWNNRLLEKSTNQYKFLKKVEDEFSSIRDEDKIKEYKLKDEEIKKQVSQNKKTKEEISEKIKDISNYHNLDKLQKAFFKKQELEALLFKKEKEFKPLKKPVKINKKDETLIDSLQKQFNEFKNAFSEIIVELIDIITSNKELENCVYNMSAINSAFERVKERNLEDITQSERYVEEINEFNSDIENIKNEILLFIQNEEGGKKYVIHNFLKQLLNQIDDLIENNADSILDEITSHNSDFLKTEIESKLLSNTIVDYSKVKQFLKITLPNAKSLLANAVKIKAKIVSESAKTGVDTSGDKYFKLKSEIEDLKMRTKQQVVVIEKYKFSYSESLGIDSDLINEYDKVVQVKANLKLKFGDSSVLNDIDGQIKELTTKKKLIMSRLDELDQRKNMNKLRWEKEEEKPKNIYSDAAQIAIKNFTKNLALVIQNLKGFEQVISDIEDGNLDKYKEEEDLSFMKIAGKIIAYSLDNKILRPDGHYVVLKNYDMIKKVFECENEVKIRKEDISTGLASANYLRQRIENMEGEYVIILLDEIGNMAKDTLMEVIKSIKKIDDEGRLVMALLTQPSSEGILINEY